MQEIKPKSVHMPVFTQSMYADSSEADFDNLSCIMKLQAMKSEPSLLEHSMAFPT